MGRFGRLLYLMQSSMNDENASKSFLGSVTLRLINWNISSISIGEQSPLIISSNSSIELIEINFPLNNFDKSVFENSETPLSDNIVPAIDAE